MSWLSPCAKHRSTLAMLKSCSGVSASRVATAVNAPRADGVQKASALLELPVVESGNSMKACREI